MPHMTYTYKHHLSFCISQLALFIVLMLIVKCRFSLFTVINIHWLTNLQLVTADVNMSADDKAVQPEVAQPHATILSCH